jgi:hypothetical protein
MSKRILFLLSNRKTDTYGVTSGLFNSATFAANFLKKSGLKNPALTTLLVLQY